MRTLDIDIEEHSGTESDPEAGRFGNLPVRVSLLGEPAEVSSVLLATRTLRAFDRGAARYPIHRVIRAAVRRPVEELFDDFAQGMGLAAQRLGEASLLLDGPGVLVSARGRCKTDYSSITIAVWTDSTTRLTSVRERLFAVIGDRRLQEQTFTIDWHFNSGHLGLTSATFEEIADPPLLDAAYPALREPVEGFIARYLEARETVLILQGPPGTGKTRFVRAVLAAMSQRKGDSAKALYTADTRALQSDEIFVEFVTGSHDAFVIEDADHLLKARADGNLDLHRFLAIADGVVRAQGRKILFTTNLPNVGDIDEALLRPGRCFANVRLDPLEKAEIERLLTHLHGADPARAGRALALALPDGRRSASLAAVYRAADSVSAR